MLSDQAVGLAGKVISGAPRDSMHMIDLAFSQDQGQRPEVIVADTGSYSDLVFGLCACSPSSTAPNWRTCPTNAAGGQSATPTTGR
jgi:TnpA family transposase